MENSFRPIYDKLPDEDKDRVMEVIMNAALYRGHDANPDALLGLGSWARGAILEIVRVAGKNGVEIMELN